jgi:Xaa-Pro aminopeptidase
MDLGARCSYYCADVTRTVPVNGHFNEMQKTIYNIVYGCNKMVAAMARPGITINDLQKATVEYLSSECLAKGFIKKKEDIINYYFHGISTSSASIPTILISTRSTKHIRTSRLSRG